MKTAKSLLHFNFNPNLLTDLGQNIIFGSTKRDINKVNKRLEKLQKKLTPFARKIPHDIGKIYHLFMKHVHENDTKVKAKFTKLRDIRKLAWSLSYSSNDHETIIDSEYINVALNIIDSHFKPSMLLALFNAIMKNWISSDTRPLKKLILKKLKQKNIRNRSFKMIQSKAHYYLDPNGIVKLCEDLIDNNKELNEVLEHLDIPWFMISFEYFSEVAETYTQILSRRPDFLKKIDEILSFLENHNSIDTYKKCVEKIILRVDTHDNTDSIKMKIMNFCFQNIGDPSSDVDWSPWNGSNNQDKINFEKARKTLNRWLANKFIYLFFDKIAMDRDRRDFWYRYINYVGAFRIYMDKTEVWKLKQSTTDIDAAILNRKLGELESGGGTSSFVLEIKDYYFVEFSKTGGACYIYKKDNKFKPNLNLSWVDIARLKHPSNRKLAVKTDSQYYYFKDEGRVFHQGKWQPKFDAWIKNYLKITV